MTDRSFRSREDARGWLGRVRGPRLVTGLNERAANTAIVVARTEDEEDASAVRLLLLITTSTSSYYGCCTEAPACTMNREDKSTANVGLSLSADSEDLLYG